jgi:type IV fimbrial biogenesis protein FimT
MLQRHAGHGFSLYELLITMAIVAVVLSLGVPSFAAMLADQRLRTEVDALFHAVHLARKESVFRRRAVTLCPIQGDAVCLPGTDWSAGWMMFVNLDRDSPATLDQGEPVLKLHISGENAEVTANRQSFSFRTTVLRATNGTLIFCDQANRAEPRALVVSYTGRPRVTRTDRRGNPYECRE